jgi:transcription-repair coupling factor (superfamily II helicase)
MSALSQKLAKIFPERQIGLVHGQLSEKEQERVMNKFYHQDLDILIGTTILETGLDVPNANTIFIDRADLLGLSQLHQLRGRVGRSYHQAYAYLFIPIPLEKLPKNSQWRLQAIYDNQELGSGFQLASTDLEIRGAGSLLSDKQSGHLQDIGMPTYKKLLEKARRSLEGSEHEEHCCKIDLFLSAYIPEKQIPCPFMRLKIYKMWQNATQISQLELYERLFIDRFGKMLPEAANKYQLSLLLIKAKKAKIKALIVKKVRVNIELLEIFTLTDKLFDLSKTFPGVMKFTGSYSIEFKIELLPQKRIAFVHAFLDYLLTDQSDEVLKSFLRVNE